MAHFLVDIHILGGNIMFIAEYDGKKYTIDDYIAMVEDAMNGKDSALAILLEHGTKLSNLGYAYPPYGLEDWLHFIARNGKAVWAIDKLYMIRQKNNDYESAIWALEEGVNILEKEGHYAPEAWYLLINNYYYDRLDYVQDEDYRRAESLMNRIGTWYKKGIAAGCNPERLEGREFAEKPVNFSSKTDKGGCYIATAVYGSYDCAEVWTLRRFRDDYLSKRTWGRCFIKTYYCISPKLVELFGDSKIFTKIFKKLLDKMVERLNGQGIENTYYEDQ